MAFPRSIAEITFRRILVTPLRVSKRPLRIISNVLQPVARARARIEHSMLVAITMGFYDRRRMKMANNTETVTEFLIPDRRYTIRIHAAVDERALSST